MVKQRRPKRQGGGGRGRASQRPSGGRVKGGLLEWQQVFRAHRQDRMTGRLIEAGPLHHTVTSDPTISHTSSTPTMKTIPQFVLDTSEGKERNPAQIDCVETSWVDDNTPNSSATRASAAERVLRSENQNSY